MRRRPDALVLGVGGVLGEAWITGVLAGITSRTGIDFRDCEQLIGTSAGSIVAAHLMAGETPRSPSEAGDEDMPVPPSAPNGSLWAGITRRAAALGMSAGAPLAPLALAATAPGAAMARAAILARSPPGSFELDELGARIDRLGARFDGRLRVVAVDRARGRRVAFGDPSAPDARVGEAVEASCAVPGVFKPIAIGGRAYVDGGVWSPTNLDLVRAGRGSQVLCLTPTGGVGVVRSVTFPWRALSRSATTVELAALHRRGATVHVVVPDRASSRAMGEDLMNPERSDRVLTAGYRQGRVLVGEPAGV